MRCCSSNGGAVPLTVVEWERSEGAAFGSGARKARGAVSGDLSGGVGKERASGAAGAAGARSGAAAARKVAPASSERTQNGTQNRIVFNGLTVLRA